MVRKGLNAVSTSIKLTKELEKLGHLAFLDVSVRKLKGGSLAISVYKKPTHTDRYLHYLSHPPLNQKVSVARTSFSRANKITFNKEKRLKVFIT